MIEIECYLKKGISLIGISKEFTFNGGEEHIEVCVGKIPISSKKIVITTILKSSSDIMKLLLVKNAIDIEYKGTSELKLGYMPYARQDRVCNKGEALSVKVMADLINSMNFTEVVVLDPHSDVTPALINNVIVRQQTSLLGQSYYLWQDIINKEVVIVAPDNGATKKIQKFADSVKVEFIQGYKTRDQETGSLSGFGYLGDVKGKHLVIMDDICDGGGTFIGLAKELLEGGAKKVDLFVTHGIFSKGIDILYEGGIDKIYTSNSFVEKPYTDSFKDAIYKKKLMILNWS